MITRMKLSRNVIKHYMSYVKLSGGPRGDAPADGDACAVDGAAPISFLMSSPSREISFW